MGDLTVMSSLGLPTSFGRRPGSKMAAQKKFVTHSQFDSYVFTGGL